MKQINKEYNRELRKELNKMRVDAFNYGFNTKYREYEKAHGINCLAAKIGVCAAVDVAYKITKTVMPTPVRVATVIACNFVVPTIMGINEMAKVNKATKFIKTRA